MCVLFSGDYYSILVFFSRLLLIYLGVWRKRSWELGCCLRHRQIPLYREMAFFVSLLYLDLWRNSVEYFS